MCWRGGWACRMPFLLGLRQVTNRLKCGGSCLLRWRMWLITFIFISPTSEGMISDFPKTELYNQHFPTRGVWAKSTVVRETLFISEEGAKLWARDRNFLVVVRGFAAGKLFVSCSCAVFIWLGFRVLSTVLKMELCLHFLKHTQLWTVFLYRHYFVCKTVDFLKRKKKRKTRKNPQKIPRKSIYICVCLCLISNKSHQMENGNMLWPTACWFLNCFESLSLNKKLGII